MSFTVGRFCGTISKCFWSNHLGI